MAPTKHLREQWYLCLAIETYKLKILNVGDKYNHVNRDGKTLEEIKADGIEILHGDLNGPASRRFLNEVGGRRV